MSIKLHHDVKHRRRRRYSTLTLALALLAVSGWCLAAELIYLIWRA